VTVDNIAHHFHLLPMLLLGGLVVFFGLLERSHGVLMLPLQLHQLAALRGLLILQGLGGPLYVFLAAFHPIALDVGGDDLVIETLLIHLIDVVHLYLLVLGYLIFDGLQEGFHGVCVDNRDLGGALGLEGRGLVL
jgi:hypothetical protein